MPPANTFAPSYLAKATSGPRLVAASAECQNTAAWSTAMFVSLCLGLRHVRARGDHNASQHPWYSGPKGERNFYFGVAKLPVVVICVHV